MKFLVKATLPNAAGNDLVRDPNFGQRIEGILGDIRPESAYFAAASGQRTVYLIVDCTSGAEVPRIVEPLWLAFGADVELIPVMDQADFQQAAPYIEQAVRTYGGQPALTR